MRGTIGVSEQASRGINWSDDKPVVPQQVETIGGSPPGYRSRHRHRGESSEDSLLSAIGDEDLPEQILHLLTNLEHAVSHHETLCSARLTNKPQLAGNREALEWILLALESIAATARGISQAKDPAALHPSVARQNGPQEIPPRPIKDGNRAMRTTKHLGSTFRVTGDTPALIERRLDAAVEAAEAKAMRDGRNGVLVMRHCPQTYIVSVSPDVPYGVTREEDFSV